MRSTEVDHRGKHSRLNRWLAYDPPSKHPYDRFVLDALDASNSDWVLDDGCGNGRFANALAMNGCQVVALDLNSFQVKAAQTSCADSVYVLRADMTNLPLRTSVFDRVLCVHNIWYVKRFHEAIDEINRVLKSGGKCVVDQLNLFNIGNLTSWRFYGILMKSLVGKAFFDVGRSCSSFVRPFSKMRHDLFSVNISSKLEVKEGRQFFASRFLVIATKNTHQER